ncbi:MAG TPA: hypothetical protein VM532_14465 [Burkholderiales bacterium]|nr:hypothetical protein [Burkholderiales bacterium]
MEKRFFAKRFGHFDFANIAYANGIEEEFVAVDLGGYVFSYDANRADEEEQHPRELKGTDLGNVINNIVRVGQSIYTVGGPRRVYKRLGMNQWQDLTATLPIPKAFLATKSNMADFYWKDLSGFSESDMYAAGGAGEVWRFDGSDWIQCAFPSNERLYNVCCAGDGNVYIGGNMGSLWVGRENKWKKLGDGAFTVPLKNIAWFGGKLWCGSEYGLWELKDGKLMRADIPAEAQLVSGAIDISPDNGLMLTAGPDGAALFDGARWEVLFNRHDLE